MLNSRQKHHRRQLPRQIPRLYRRRRPIQPIPRQSHRNTSRAQQRGDLDLGRKRQGQRPRQRHREQQDDQVADNGHGRVDQVQRHAVEALLRLRRHVGPEDGDGAAGEDLADLERRQEQGEEDDDEAGGVRCEAAVAGVVGFGDEQEEGCFCGEGGRAVEDVTEVQGLIFWGEYQRPVFFTVVETSTRRSHLFENGVHGWLEFPCVVASTAVDHCGNISKSIY